MTPARVLVVEDEEMLRQSMVRGLAKLPGVTIVDAATIGAALQSIDEEPPKLILSDIDLPDRSGIELLGELGRRHLRIPVVFISAYLKAYASQIPPHAAVEVREKPVHLDELRDLVVRKLGSVKEQETAPFSVSDYLQLACMGRHSVAIEVVPMGRIIVHQGQLHTAQDDQGVGEAAFRRMLFATGTQVRVMALQGEPGDRTIHSSWEGVLLEAARLQDEETVRVPTPARAATPPPPSEEEQFAFAMDAGINALLAKDLPRALTAFLRAQQLRPTDGKVLANVKRLQEMGVVPREPDDELL